jgi:DNA primase
MFSKIYSILVEILGQSKQGYYSKDTTQYQFNCPSCADDNGGIPDGKHNLEIILSPNKLAFHCWKCGDYNSMKGRLSTLIKRYGTLSLYNDYKQELDSLIKSKMYDINSYQFDEKVDTDTFVKLPKTFTKINISNCADRRVSEYLTNRKITQDIVDKFNIGYTTWDESNPMERNRIIIPSYDSYGDLNFWVGRDYTGKHKAKYKNCEAEKKDIIFQESLIDFDADIILCEGAIDCLYGINTIAMLGKTLTKDTRLYQALVQKARGKIYICLDNDTSISETKKIYSLLNIGRLKGKIKYIRMNRLKDFGELYEQYGKKGIIMALQSAKQFTEIDLVFE